MFEFQENKRKRKKKEADCTAGIDLVHSSTY
jgi:hypothetical protein